MADTDRKWGHCKNCAHFASKAGRPIASEEASCHHPVLAKYELNVFGACGCRGFELRAGLPESVEQSASQLTV